MCVSAKAIDVYLLFKSQSRWNCRLEDGSPLWLIMDLVSFHHRTLPSPDRLLNQLYIQWAVKARKGPDPSLKTVHLEVTHYTTAHWQLSRTSHMPQLRERWAGQSLPRCNFPQLLGRENSLVDSWQSWKSNDWKVQLHQRGCWPTQPSIDMESSIPGSIFFCWLPILRLPLKKQSRRFWGKFGNHEINYVFLNNL